MKLYQISSTDVVFEISHIKYHNCDMYMCIYIRLLLDYKLPLTIEKANWRVVCCKYYNRLQV